MLMFLVCFSAVNMLILFIFNSISSTKWSNLVDFDQIGRIRPNSIFGFKFTNSNNRKSNKFEWIRPSLICSMLI